MARNQIQAGRTTGSVVGVSVDAVDWTEAVDRIIRWTRLRESKIVGICSVHSVVTALKDQEHAKCMKDADMVTPDGAPVAWMLRRKGHSDQARISGPDLMIKCCEKASEAGVKMFLYGGTEASLSQLERFLRDRFPLIQIVGSYSPPFRPLTDDEDKSVVERINNSGAEIVWVGLGCPKQEAWMYSHRGRVKAVMIGVGAAFDFHAGVIKRAPLWMQRYGLEWVHRMSQDPRRLVKRYLVTNTIFVLAVLRESLIPRLSGQSANRAHNPAK
jgi:N-acetylglucosaminyldiphosphoundecaprenol N-acetyl-beta-D-mannosaminyltransferase